MSAYVSWHLDLQSSFPPVLSGLQSCLRVWVTPAHPSLFPEPLTHTNIYRVTLAVREASFAPGVCAFTL